VQHLLTNHVLDRGRGGRIRIHHAPHRVLVRRDRAVLNLDRPLEMAAQVRDVGDRRQIANAAPLDVQPFERRHLTRCFEQGLRHAQAAEDDERPGPPCYCGKRGCLETFISGTGLAADYAAKERGSARVDAATVVARAAGGDAVARGALDRYSHRLGRGLATIVNVLDPDAIVLGGGMSNVGELYQTVPRLLPAFVFSDRVDTVLVAPKHGDSSGVRGAAWLWSLEEAGIFARKAEIA